MFGLVILLLVYALPAALPSLAVVWILRGRLSANTAGILVALAFMPGPAYLLWRMEWFDVWRHGTPSLSYLVTAYMPYLAGFAALGWFLGRRLSRVPVNASYN